jgi:predicted TIM-barrel fold metal-dependent hydrolase
MIIDNHVHLFPDQAGTAGYEDLATHGKELQKKVGRLWRDRMVTSHTDLKYIPEPGEDVGFSVGKYGKWQWTKHGETCWMLRGPVALENMVHSPEQVLAQMDAVCVDMAVLEGGYMEPNYERTQFVPQIIKKWPDRFIGTVSIQYDLTQSDEYLQGEILKLTEAVEEHGFKGLFSALPKGQPVDDPRCDPLWKEAARLGVPVCIDTGLNSREDYMAEIRSIESVCRRFPELNVIDGHVGGNLRNPKDPEYVDNPREFFDLFKLGNFYLEFGCVLIFERWSTWGRDYEYPYRRHEQFLRTAYENFGARNLIWGTDIPWCQRVVTYRQNWDVVRLHTEFMTDEDRALIMGDNLARIYKVG